MVAVTSQASGELAIPGRLIVRSLKKRSPDQKVAVVANVHYFIDAGRKCGVGTVTTHTRRSRKIRSLEDCDSMSAVSIFRELVCRNTVLLHQLGILMATGAGTRDIGRVDVAPAVFRGKNRVGVVAIGAGRCVQVAPFEKQLAVSAGAELGQLTGWNAVLAHHVCVRVTRRTQFDGRQLPRSADIPPTVRLVSLVGSGIATVTVVTPDTVFRVDSQRECPAFLGVADETSISGIGGHTQTTLLVGAPRGCW
jgi:hypothetical protein